LSRVLQGRRLGACGPTPTYFRVPAPGIQARRFAFWGYPVRSRGSSASVYLFSIYFQV